MDGLIDGEMWTWLKDTTVHFMFLSVMFPNKNCEGFYKISIVMVFTVALTTNDNFKEVIFNPHYVSSSHLIQTVILITLTKWFLCLNPTKFNCSIVTYCYF